MSKKQIAEETKEEIIYPRYISNKPKGEDMFKGKSQERLASAIAMHITETDKEKNPVFARLIGLEGKWGSGKSNVIQQVEGKLKDTYTFFTFDAWGMKAIPEVTNQKSINTIFNDSTWIDALLVVKTPLSDALLKKAVEEMTAQPVVQFAPANTANHTNNYWDSLLKKLIDTPYVSADNYGTLNLFAAQLLDAVARGAQIGTDACWKKILDKVDYANISGEVVELRNKILNGQSGYEMTPTKFNVLHIWLRQADMASRPVDAANMVLGKVVENAESQAIVLSEKDYYTPMISGTVETASGLHKKLKSIVKNANDTDFAKYVAGIVRYEKES